MEIHIQTGIKDNRRSPHKLLLPLTELLLRSQLGSWYLVSLWCIGHRSPTLAEIIDYEAEKQQQRGKNLHIIEGSFSFLCTGLLFHSLNPYLVGGLDF